jgi:hypothetical protein
MFNLFEIDNTLYFEIGESIQIAIGRKSGHHWELHPDSRRGLYISDEYILHDFVDIKDLTYQAGVGLLYKGKNIEMTTSEEEKLQSILKKICDYELF